LSIHARPELIQVIQRDGLLAAFESDIPGFVRSFGSPLSRRIHVYLFERVEQIRRIYKNVGGFAVFEYNLVAAPLDENCRAIFRHEVTHLFANRLGPGWPVFKMEGLCMFFQCDGGVPRIGEPERRVLAAQMISALLRTSFFLHPKNRDACYIIAGNFTQWLIDRFGWQAYCRFYRAARQRNFQRVFEQTFGIALSQAETLWRETVAKRGY